MDSDQEPKEIGRCTVGVLQVLGALGWVLAGLWAITAFLGTLGIPGVTDSPTYARTWMTYSLAHNFERPALSPPPPPSF